VVASPITGPAGNHEYLLWLRQGDWAADETAAETPPSEEAIRRLVAATLAS
ncbi:MAG: TlyA family rRNA (cytidine-2'-O)-methyltransferase, partial [Betaproteobacteria bacterium]|nr:TlyA family rRNA (cytidine-2'-O)-methyltransferase [Betaproteobacteria bacterium]